MTVSIKQHFKHAPTQESIEFKRIIDATLADLTLLRAEVVLVGTTLANIKTIYDAHTHTADGEATRTSKPDTGSPTGSPDGVSAITDSSTAIGSLNLVS